jgi:long-chain acyl-CoA synthetase
MILKGYEIIEKYLTPLVDNGDLVLKTSGTTGEPKEVRHNLSEFLKRYLVSRPGYITLITLDLTRLGGIDALLHAYFYDGTAVIPDTKFPLEVLQLIEKYKVELLITSPSFLRFLLLEDIESFDLSSLEIIAYGSEKMSDSLLYSISKVFPYVKIKQTYGLTEVGTLRTHSEGNKIKLLDIEWKVVDDILYVKNSDGWICTNDRVQQLDDYLIILGRDSNVINVAGHKVQAERVEEVLEDACKDALVYGEPNALLGEIVVADIVSFDSPQDILTHCNSRLEKYEVPMRFNFVDKIERNSNGKKVRK